MQLAIDANIYFAALLRNNLTRKLVFDERLNLYAPRFILNEFDKYKKELQNRTKINQQEFNKLAALILKKIQFVPEEQLRPFLPAAITLTIDPKDTTYLACALAVNADLWTHDKALNQNRVKTWNTTQLAKHLGYLPP